MNRVIAFLIVWLLGVSAAVVVNAQQSGAPPPLPFTPLTLDETSFNALINLLDEASNKPTRRIVEMLLAAEEKAKQDKQRADAVERNKAQTTHPVAPLQENRP